MSFTTDTQAKLNMGGVVTLPPGRFTLDPGGLVIPPNAQLIGAGQSTTLMELPAGVDTTAITFRPGFQGAKVENLTVYGAAGPAVKSPTITLPADCIGYIMRDVTAWFGARTLDISSVDCLIENCNLGVALGNAAIWSHGANWWVRCKIDAAADASQYPLAAWGFNQRYSPADSIVENYFVGCDFSGYTGGGVYINDPLHQAATKFTGCVVGSGEVVVLGAKWTSFSDSEFGCPINNQGTSPITVANSFGVNGPIQMIGPNFHASNNVP